MPMWKTRSSISSTSVMPSTGVASTWMMRGGVDAPHEQRHIEPAHAGRAQLVHRRDEVEAGEDRREAQDEHRHGHQRRPLPSVVVE